jgi:hypothetical protein
MRTLGFCRTALLLCLLSLAGRCLAMGQGSPTWQYSFEEGRLRITVSARALNTDEEVTKAECAFSVVRDGETSMRSFSVAVPIRGGEVKDGIFTDGFEKGDRVKGIAMSWTVGHEGSLVGAFPPSTSKFRKGSSPPEN